MTHPRRRFEDDLDRQLNGLPDLTAPSTLIPRVSRAIEALERIPWYRRSWDFWPRTVRVAMAMALCVGFALICFGGWKIREIESVSAGLAMLGVLGSALSAIGQSINAVRREILWGLSQVHPAYLISCAAAALLGISVCTALVTSFVKVGLASARKKTI